VAGLIFVDASHPDQLQRMPASIRRKQMAVNWASQALPLLARVGAVRLALGPSGEASFLESQPKYAAALLSELDAFPESSAETKAAATSFGDLPIIVLTAGVDATGDPAMYTLWRNELQPELARLSTRGHQIIVEGATHMIMTRRPQAIVDAVREMLGTLKK
jgi:pimeloyl-ACP methyl ester carboxylesterase